MWLSALYFFILILQRKVLGYIEYVKTNGCESCALRLTCRHLDSIIAVIEANFEVESKSIYNDTFPTAFPRTNPRIALNQRCSGVNHCSFILTKDCPGAEKWGFGTLYVKYACVSDTRLTKYCNTDILLPEPETLGISQGFIHNPGYPRFYPGKQTCRWSIRAPPLQRIKVTIFDISLIGNPNDNRCTDVLEVSDRGQILYNTCQQEETPTEILSLDDSLDVTLIPSKTEKLLPTRGVLLFYTAIGCLTPIAPRDGYLVYRNDTTAEYSCCVGYSFSDTKKRSKIITCSGYRWNTTLPLPDCKCVTEGQVGYFTPDYDNVSKMTEENNINEIVIPSIVIVALFLINSVVLFIIYRYKKKQLQFTEEELGTLPVKKYET